MGDLCGGMRRVLSAVGCLSILVLSSCQDPASLNRSIWNISNAWAPVGSPAISTDYVVWTSVALGPDRTPYVAFVDGGSSAKATVMRYSGAAWANVGSAGFSSTSVDCTKLAIDSNGRLYVAYVDQASPHAVTVMTYTGAGTTGWQTVGPVGFSGGTGWEVSIAIGPGDVPFVAYPTQTSLMLTVMKYESGSGAWVPAGPTTGFSNVTNVSLAFDKAGTPYVAYNDGNWGEQLSAVSFNGSSWVRVGAQGFSATSVYYPSLAIDSAGTPYVAFEDTDSAHEGVCVMQFSGGTWSFVGQQHMSAGTAYDVSLALTPSGTPYVAYVDGNPGPATVKRLSGGSWVPVGRTGFSGGDVGYTTIAIDSSGVPYVAYQDSSLHWNFATVMRYQ